MRNLFLIIMLISSQIAFAEGDARLVLEFKQPGNVQANMGGKIISGDLQKRVGAFSQWTFQTDKEHGFDVIVNNKTHKVLSQKSSMEAGGPFLIAASPDNKYVVFDYGTSAGLRDFSVLTPEGKVMFKTIYLGELVWTKQGLRYGKPSSVSLNLNSETKKCTASGVAWQVQTYVFDGVKNKKIAGESKIECGE